MSISYQEIINKINSELPLKDLASSYVKDLVYKSGRYQGTSPFNPHEKTPSFFISPDKNLFYCFSTAQGGDVVNFYMKVNDVDFIRALKELCQKLNIEFDFLNSKTYDKTEINIINDRVDLYNQIINTFDYFLFLNKNVLNYLYKRGFKDETLKHYGIGYCPSFKDFSLYKFLRNKGYSDDFLNNKSNLFSNNIQIFQNRIIFPIKDLSGKVIAFGARKLKDEDFGAKYLNSKESENYKKKEVLYGFFEALEYVKKSKSVYIVEGYLDVLAFWQSGIKNVVACSGTAFNEKQLDLLNRYVEEIILCFDADIAGFKASKRTIEIILKKSFNIAIYILPLAFDDPASLLLNKKEKAIQILIENKEDFFLYLVKKAISDYNYQNKDHYKQSLIKDKITKELYYYLSFFKTKVLKDSIKEKINKNIENEIKKNLKL